MHGGRPRCCQFGLSTPSAGTLTSLARWPACQQLLPGTPGHPWGCNPCQASTAGSALWPSRAGRLPSPKAHRLSMLHARLRPSHCCTRPYHPCQDIEHRRPYESLLLCWPAHLFSRGPPGADSAAALPAEAAGQQAAAAAADREAAARGRHPQAAEPAAGFHLLPGRELVIAAVPPADHSRKPHLGELLLPLLPPGARCLEVGTALPGPPSPPASFAADRPQNRCCSDVLGAWKRHAEPLQHRAEGACKTASRPASCVRPFPDLRC